MVPFKISFMTRVIYLHIWCPSKKGFMVIYIQLWCPSNKFYDQGCISPHSVSFKKRSGRRNISPHCVSFKISFKTSDIDWGNISPHLVSFKKNYDF